MPPEVELSINFLPSGDGAVDSAFGGRPVVLAVAGQVEDLCENLLLKDWDMCDSVTAGCSARLGDGAANTTSVTTLGVL